MSELRACAECGESMLGKRPQAVYCSKKCGNAAWQKANRDHANDLQRDWQRNNRDRSRESRKALYRVNGDRHKEYREAWRKANRGRLNGLRRTRRAANPDHSKELGRLCRQTRRARLRCTHGSLSTSELRARLETFGGACCYCGTKGQPLEADHFLPLSAGGTHNASNIVPACKSCNSSKNARDPEQWFRAQPFFTERRWQEILKAVGKAKQHHGQLALL